MGMLPISAATSLRAKSVFVGFLRCPAGHHRAFTDWHDVDHRPENVAQMRHMYHSERWVSPPDMLAERHVAPDCPFDDAGHYLHTYWSSATPHELIHDMIAVREQLEVLGRCEQINRDFMAVWRDRTSPVFALSSPVAPGISIDALPLTRNAGVVVSLFGAPRRPDEALARYHSAVVPTVTRLDDVLGVYTLNTSTGAAGNTDSTRIVVQLCFVRANALGVQQQLGNVERELGEHPGTCLFRGSYVPSTFADPTPYE